MRNKKLFYIVTTIPLSLNFFRGQLAYLSNNFEIVAISSDRDALEKFGETEGIETHCIPMVRSISLLHDFKSLIKIISFFIPIIQLQIKKYSSADRGACAYRRLLCLQVYYQQRF